MLEISRCVVCNLLAAVERSLFFWSRKQIGANSLIRNVSTFLRASVSVCSEQMSKANEESTLQLDKNYELSSSF